MVDVEFNDNEKELEVYTKKNCPPCKKLKFLLDYKKIKYREIDIHEVESAMDFLITNNIMSVPAVFIDGEPVVGPLNLESIQSRLNA